ncbi:MAG: hypothetical protein DMF78_06080 [Acidobacteria bacterium]|nr:MAG: hypothetical protein DMF78_06080 [Acidobacteriota bacterium]
MPRSSRGQAAGSRNIPAAVRRAVWSRDGGRCAFVSLCGRRCGERRFVEFHHVIAHSAGGRPTVENIQLRCRAHNGHEVDLFFGPGKRYTLNGDTRSGTALVGKPHASQDEYSYRIGPIGGLPAGRVGADPT